LRYPLLGLGDSVLPSPEHGPLTPNRAVFSLVLSFFTPFFLCPTFGCYWANVSWFVWYLTPNFGTVVTFFPFFFSYPCSPYPFPSTWFAVCYRRVSRRTLFSRFRLEWIRPVSPPRILSFFRQISVPGFRSLICLPSLAVRFPPLSSWCHPKFSFQVFFSPLPAFTLVYPSGPSSVIPGGVLPVFGRFPIPVFSIFFRGFA